MITIRNNFSRGQLIENNLIYPYEPEEYSLIKAIQVYVPAQKGYGFCAVSVWNRCRFYPFLSGIGYGFRGLRGCMDVFVVSIPSERRSNMLIRNGFQEIFLFERQSKIDDLISTCTYTRSGVKTGVEITFFSLKLDRDLENWAAHPHQKFPGIPSRINREQMFDLAWQQALFLVSFSFALRKVRTAEQMSKEKTIWTGEEKEDTEKK